MMRPSLRVLLVEDNPGDARLVQEAFLESNFTRFEVEHAPTLAHATEQLTRNRADVVLLDLSLPDGQGLRSAARFMSAFPNVPFIILTGLDDEAVGLDAVRQGAQDYVIKGQFDGKFLIRVIRYAIERKQAAIEKEEMIRELKDLFHQVKVLKGILPVCSWCKKIREDSGDWVAMETYVSQHLDAGVSHGICPDCAENLRKSRL